MFFFNVGVPTSGEGGGVKPVGTKSQVYPKKLLDGSPYGPNADFPFFRLSVFWPLIHFFPKSSIFLTPS